MRVYSGGGALMNEKDQAIRVARLKAQQRTFIPCENLTLSYNRESL